jgi:hypothetical protein
MLFRDELRVQSTNFLGLVEPLFELIHTSTRASIPAYLDLYLEI